MKDYEAEKSLKIEESTRMNMHISPIPITNCRKMDELAKNESM